MDVEPREPTDEEMRERLMLLIRENYIKEGGMMMNKNNPFPLDLHSLTMEELSNVLDNMLLESNRRKRDGIIDRTVSTVGNMVSLAATAVGYTVPSEITGTIENDLMLKEGLVALMAGKGFKPSVPVTLGLCTLYYGSKILSNYISDKRVSQNGTGLIPTVHGTERETGQGATGSSMGQVQAPGSSSSGGEIAEWKNNAGSKNREPTVTRED